MFNHGRFLRVLMAPLCLAALSAQLPAQPSRGAPPQPDAMFVQPGVEVLARGPVHEAFAEPLLNQPQPTPLISRQPPPSVNEVPAEQKPVGEAVQWIPGYWAWDDDRLDFVWVSGIWRKLPPGRQWVPGHWHPVGTRWQWVPGLWAPLERQADFTYLPPPPPMLDAFPPGLPPGPRHTFVSGCWVFHDNHYLWRRGYWVPHVPNWIWIPAHHVWTPGGYLLVDGYWDYSLHQRGLLFAPVALDIRQCTRPTFVYQPRYVVHNECLYGALFLHPTNRHYYFGDYFDARYLGQGYTAWFDVRFGGAHDPLFGYYRLEQSDPRVWEHGVREFYAARRAHTVPRPPQTLAQQNTIVNGIDKSRLADIQQATVVVPLAQLTRADLTLQPIAPAVYRADLEAAQQLNEVSRQRRHLESHLSSGGKAALPIGPQPVRTVQLTLPKTAPTGIASGVSPPPLPTLPLHQPELVPNRFAAPAAPLPLGPGMAADATSKQLPPGASPQSKLLQSPPKAPTPKAPVRPPENAPAKPKLPQAERKESDAMKSGMP